MLFNSYIFIFAFLPCTLVVFFWMGSRGYTRLAIGWLTLASLLFYAFWQIEYVALLMASILLNYVCGVMLANSDNGKSSFNEKHRKYLLVASVVLNLLFLGFFKYANFFAENLNAVFGLSIRVGNVLLPLGISFFTFTQIAFLVDVHQGKAKEYDLLRYILFVTFFPHLIAGPILHHSEMMPQFADKKNIRLRTDHIAEGLTVFAMGLFKKMILADGIGPYANPVFSAVAKHAEITFLEAWVGALAYTFQLYFDFSGYSDMAVGLAFLFNIRMPMNFYSPYKATSIIDFWNRWHMTLSRYLRQYVYIPLGGNQKGQSRRYINLLVTMIIGGLWHGASWTFVLWGAYHGFLLAVNHMWRDMRLKVYFTSENTKYLGGCITFLAVVAGWVLFRADTLEAASSILWTMSGLNGVSLEFPNVNYNKAVIAVWIVGLSVIVWFAPNTNEFMGESDPTLKDTSRIISAKKRITLKWSPGLVWSVLIGIFLAGCTVSLSQQSEFLYFQF